ncbi:EpsG family protein [Bacillus massilinigeriensis]|uniref:EpsG family protein n=1 Tax=Bacillus massilionigeriensis TaxID=1805475 RepID=UPI00096B2CC5|nr:EpsG family protein [Bacillus massilionigeriensis]
MWIYFTLSFYIILTALWNKIVINSRHVYLFLTLGLLGFLSAFRSSSIGNDTATYLYLFTISPDFELELFDSRYEVGYVLLNKVLNLITPNPQIILIASSILIICGFYRFIIKYSEIPWISTFLFFALGYWGQMMNTIRQNIAIVILLLSYDFIKKKKVLPFILLVLFASLFHRTAIIFLLAYPIAQLKFNLKTVLTSLAIAVSGLTFFGPLLELALGIFPLYQYYLGGVYLDDNIRLATILNIIVITFILLFGRFIVQKQFGKQSNIDQPKNFSQVDYRIFSLFILVGIVIEIISMKFSLLNRVGVYFSVFLIAYLPNVINSIRDKNLRTLIIMIVVLLFFLYSTVIQIYRPEWNDIYPYQFFWQ